MKRKLQTIQIVTLSLAMILVPCFSFAQSDFIHSYDGRHYSYFPTNPQEDLGDTFYRNNEFLRCEATKVCEPEKTSMTAQSTNSSTPESPKKFAYFVRREKDGFIVPIFIQCHSNGAATASTAEDLVPYLNETVLDNGDCLDETEISENVAPSFVENTLNAVQSYEAGCPKQDLSCMEQVAENFTRDLKNAMNIFKVSNESKTEMGCLSNVLSTVIDSLYQTLKLFVYDLPKGVLNVGKSVYNYFWGEEEEQTTAMLASSVMSEDMANALVAWDLPKFYSLLKKNFFKFIGQIKEFYGEMLGCTEWNGIPFNSQCLKKMNWSCPTCDHVMNFTCGLVGQLGAGFAMGGILGTGNSIVQMNRMKKAIGTNPSKYQMGKEAISEMMAKTRIPEMVTKAKSSSRKAAFHTARYTRPMTQFLTTAKEDIRFVLGVGDSFRGFIAATPPTMPYHYMYQLGKSKAFRKMNDSQVKKSGVNTMKLGRAYAVKLDEISEGFESLLPDLNKLRGKNFDPDLYAVVKDEYLALAQKNLKSIGMNVERLPDNKGLKISKGEQSFDYIPEFDERLKAMPDRIEADEMKKIFMDSDPLMTKDHHLATQNHMPDFWRRVQDKAHESRGMFVVKPDALDGYVYMAQISSQVGQIPETKDCSGKLNGAKILRSQEIVPEKEN
jgi:hypothetical protein